MKVRICRSCKTENSPTNIECSTCGGNISNIRPIEKNENVEKPEHAISDTPEIRIHQKPGATLRFLIEDRQELEAKDSDIIGRNAVGADFLQNFPTVSRNHIRVFKQNGAWWMKNLTETNETWLNGKPVPQNEEREINEGDVLNLSSKCRLSVR